MDKKLLRSYIFRHLDGIVVPSVIHQLSQKGILEFILQNQSLDLEKIAKEFNANEGYLNVGLRILASQGYLNYELNNSENTVKISTNENSEKAFSYVGIYTDLAEFLSDEELISSQAISDDLGRKWMKIYE